MRMIAFRRRFYPPKSFRIFRREINGLEGFVVGYPVTGMLILVVTTPTTWGKLQKRMGYVS